jgi:hypothetical protein
MIYAALAHLFMFILALALLWSEGTWQSYLGEMVTSWIAGTVSVIFLIMVSALVALHMFLIWHDMTTF